MAPPVSLVACTPFLRVDPADNAILHPILGQVPVEFSNALAVW
jgi:hypothetical protein